MTDLDEILIDASASLSILGDGGLCLATVNAIVDSASLNPSSQIGGWADAPSLTVVISSNVPRQLIERGRPVILRDGTSSMPLAISTIDWAFGDDQVTLTLIPRAAK